nr:hypothetical protein [Mesorhizobium metallidurans]
MSPRPRNTRPSVSPSPFAASSAHCARNGGCFAGSYAVVGGVSEVLPVDLHIPGCPPPPIEILKGLLALLEGVNATHRG